MVCAQIRKIQGKLKEKNVDAFLITNPVNQHYLTASEVEGIIFLTPQRCIFITNFCYGEQAKAEIPDFEIKVSPDKFKIIKQLIKKYKIKNLGFETNTISYGEYQNYKEKLSVVKLIPYKNLVEDFRLIKKKNEIVKIKKAAQITDATFNDILKIIKVGLREREIAHKIEYFLREKGAERSAFEIIVVSGKRTSLPHGKPSDKRIEKGDFLLMDFGACYEGYNADLTRTIILGKIKKKQQEIYDLVCQAQDSAFKMLKGGVSCSFIDRKARNVIKKAGLGKFFGHNLGHGIGKAVHEAPFLAPHNDSSLKPGMVVTIEPAVYIPQWGGVRMEEMALITEKGYELLTKAPKELREI